MEFLYVKNYKQDGNADIEVLNALTNLNLPKFRVLIFSYF
jgi:hypothetical protein